MKKNIATLVFTTLAVLCFFILSTFQNPIEPPDPPDTWEELFETSEQFTESSYSTFVGVLSSASRPSSVQGGKVIYGQFLSIDIKYRINSTVFLVDKLGFYIPISSNNTHEPIEGFRIGDHVEVKGYPSFYTDIDDQKYKSLQLVSIELIEN